MALSTVTLFIILIFCVGLVSTSGVFTILAAIHDKDIKGYSKDSDLQEAHKYLTWASIVVWVSLAILLVVILLFFIFVPEMTFSVLGKFFFGAIFLLLLVLLGFTGVLSSMAAQKISASKQKSSSDKSRASWYSITAAATSLGAIVFLIIMAILKLYISMHHGKSHVQSPQASGTQFFM